MMYIKNSRPFGNKKRMGVLLWLCAGVFGYRFSAVKLFADFTVSQFLADKVDNLRFSISEPNSILLYKKEVVFSYPPEFTENLTPAPQSLSRPHRYRKFRTK